LRTSPSGIAALPGSLLADVAQLVNWAEAISRQRAEYLLTLEQYPVAGIIQRLRQKQREIARASAEEKHDLEESQALLESAVERHQELQREVRSIENQHDMIESLIQNLILSTPNVPSARDQIMRVKRNVETYQTVNREVRERLAQRPPLSAMLGSREP
jgi:seryl-tRNA synthetase